MFHKDNDASKSTANGSNDDLSEAQRRILRGKNIGDWVIAYNSSNQAIAHGQIVDVDVKNADVHIKSRSRYTLIDDGYIKGEEDYTNVVSAGVIAKYSDSSLKEASGSNGVSPYVENLGRCVHLTCKSTEEYLGRIARVYGNCVVLNPHIDTWNVQPAEGVPYVIVNDNLFLGTDGMGNPKPLSKSLEEIVVKMNDKAMKNIPKEAKKKRIKVSS